MPYNFDIDVSANISPKVAEEMIRKVIEEQTGKKVASIQFQLRKVTKGFSMNGYEDTFFDGIKVFFVAEKK